MQAQDCTKADQTAPPTCPTGGTLNVITKRCEATATVTYSCPTGYTLGADDKCSADPICAQGALDNETLQCITGTTYT